MSKEPLRNKKTLQFYKPINMNNSWILGLHNLPYALAMQIRVQGRQKITPTYKCCCQSKIIPFKYFHVFPNDL